MARPFPGTSNAAPSYVRPLAGAIIVLGFGLRASGFTEPWLNPDEGIYYQLAVSRSWSHFFEGVANNAHPPLQYLLLRGLSALSSDFTFLRSPSLLAGTLTIYAMIRLGTEAAGWRTGLLAGAAVALAPGAIVLSQVMRPYALLLLLLTTAAWLGLRTLRTHRPRDLILHTLALGLALCTHYAAYLALPVFAALLLGDAFLADRTLRERVRRCAAQGVLVSVGFAAYSLHVQPFLLGGPLQREAQRGWLAPFMHDGAFDTWLGFIDAQRYLFGAAFEVPAVLLFLLGLVALLMQRRWAPALLGAGVAGAAAIAAALELLPLGSTRHSVYLAAFTVPVMAAPPAALWARGWRLWLPAAALAGVIVAWPAVPRAWLGADQLQTRNPAEHVTSAHAVRRTLEAIEPWTHEPNLIVVDRQTFYFLAPIFHRLSSPDRHGRGAVLAGFRWGEADVVVSQAWTLRVGPGGRDAPGHLRHFLGRADRALPGLQIRNREAGALLFGGWNVERYAALEAHAQPSRVEGWRVEPGLVRARIDWRQYQSEAADRPPAATHESPDRNE